MKFEEILKRLGDFEAYQKIQCFLLSLPIFVTAMHSLSFVFIGATPNFRCKSHSSCLLNQTIPPGSGFEGFSKCKKYSINASTEDCDVIVNNMTSRIDCTEWYYDDSMYKTSLTAEWNLVCDKIYLKALVQSIYMFGMLIGAIVLGDLSDRFGRKKIFFFSLILQVVSGLTSAAASAYVPFVIGRFLLGVSHSGIYLSGFVIAMEFLGNRGKVYGAMLTHFNFALGFMMVSLLAYLIRVWQWLQIVLSAPGLLFISYWWLVPESARWLVSKHRYQEAKQVILKAAKLNKVSVPQHFLDHQEDVKEMAHKQEKANAIDLLTYGPRLRKNALILHYTWFVVSTVYWGLSLSTSALPGGSPYINLMLSGVAEIGSILFCLAFMNRIGRKFCVTFGMICSGVCCIVAAYIPVNQGYNWLIQIIVYIGKSGSSISFCTVFNYSVELFPTVARNAGIGFSSMCARIGGVITPFISLLGEYFDNVVPMTIFGVMALSAGLLDLMLPETANRPIPDTLEEAENYARQDKEYYANGSQRESEDILKLDTRNSSETDNDQVL